MINFKDFISTQEGKIFTSGVLLLIVYIISIVNLYLFSVADANNLVGMTATNLFFGRAAGISYGYSANFPDLAIVIMNIIIEFIMVLIIYPLFVLSWNKSLKLDFLHNIFQKIKIQKIKYQDIFNKYGKYGLFIFVWFPFWMTGPVVGAIIGFLIGIRHYTTIAIVLSGTSLAIIIWTFFLKELIVLLNQISSNAPYLILAIFVLTAITIRITKIKDN